MKFVVLMVIVNGRVGWVGLVGQFDILYLFYRKVKFLGLKYVGCFGVF